MRTTMACVVAGRGKAADLRIQNLSIPFVVVDKLGFRHSGSICLTMVSGSLGA